MITEKQHAAAKLIVEVNPESFEDHYKMFTRMSYDEYKALATELEKLNTSGKGYALMCMEDYSHPTLVYLHGRIIRDGKTGEDIEEDMEQEGQECTIDKGHKIVSFYGLDDFEGWVREEVRQ